MVFDNAQHRPPNVSLSTNDMETSIGERNNTDIPRSVAHQSATTNSEGSTRPLPGATQSTASKVVPRTTQEALDILRQSRFDNIHCKQALKLLRIHGAQNAKLETKRQVLASKMVQRGVALNTICNIMDGSCDYSEREYMRVTCLPATTVRIRKLQNDIEAISWIKGDRPVFENDKIVVGQPELGNEGHASFDSSRRPDFEAAEYCRLLHVLADSRMTATRQRLMHCLTREELDAEIEDPWSESIAPLFNDPDFKPEAVTTLSGGVTLSDVATLNPSHRPHLRDAGVLKRKFGEFKSFYGTCLSRFEASGQSDPESFVNFADGRTYIMYAHCFLQQHPILTPLATRALRSDAQREEGVGIGVHPPRSSTSSMPRSGSKRQKLHGEERTINMERLVSVLQPQDRSVAKELEAAERDKMIYEALQARERWNAEVLTTIEKAKRMIQNASSEEEKKALQTTLKRSIESLRNGAPST